eukprot:CAMPEP_0115206868 /NCGR_PEP_ID=MMETSP0270-20121206/20425_1 /TAXON_ID=71861 /ORGANISM="Scrippsiella trochoidea, Strain CCMP3099" /LENGTH=440 /DNA_ID=CAMNT_0002620449 /DNA_START=67 /DNA_END=1387 /DNA_ORIENTATION=+
MPAAKGAKVVSLATDCSGMETPVMALRNLGVEVNHLFSCDVNKHVKATIMANFPPKVWYDDLTKRDNSTAAKADLYVAGFPCQPFSSAGKKEGFGDKKGRGTVFFKVREYIEEAQPRVFVLENVSNLVRMEGGKYFKDILESLEDLGTYNIYHQMVNTKEHGVPQNRRRIYFVGVKKSVDTQTFKFPEPVKMPSIEKFLDEKTGPVDDTMLPPERQGTARANVVKVLQDLQAQGRDPFNEPWVIDCDSSENRMKKPMLDCAPCLTCSRGGGHWVTNRGRRMNKTEMMRLQAMTTPAEGFQVAVSDPQLGKQIGNAMSVNILERLFARLLPAARLAEPGSLVDRWATSAADGDQAAPSIKRAMTPFGAGGSLLKRAKVAEAKAALGERLQGGLGDGRLSPMRRLADGPSVAHSPLSGAIVNPSGGLAEPPDCALCVNLRRA